MVGRLSVCAVHVRMSGDARTGLAHELRVNEGLWVWVLVALEGPVVLLEQPVFCQVEEAQEVGMDEASSPPFRGCRVLEVVVPYLRAVYAKRPVARQRQAVIGALS